MCSPSASPSPFTREVTFQRFPRGHCYYKTPTPHTSHHTTPHYPQEPVIWFTWHFHLGVFFPRPPRSCWSGRPQLGKFSPLQLHKLFICRRSLSWDSLTSCCSLNSVGVIQACAGRVHSRPLRCGSAFCLAQDARGNHMALFQTYMKLYALTCWPLSRPAICMFMSVCVHKSWIKVMMCDGRPSPVVSVELVSVVWHL